MMSLSLVTALVLSQSYVRSRVDDKNPASQCLWWKENTTVEFHQSADGNPESTGDSEFVAISRAIATWQNQLSTCSSLSVVDGPRTSNRLVGYFEDATNENITVFRLKKCNDVVPAGNACRTNDNCGNNFDCWQHQEAAIAITTTSYNPKTGRVLDSDIEFNVPSFLFTTVDSPPCPSGQPALNCIVSDIQNTTTHEIGHSLGLAHSGTPGGTMNPRANAGEISKRTLDADTARFACEAYPKGAAAKTCFITPVDDSLGKAVGCSTGEGSVLALAVMAWLRRRRTA
jgi:hypothetical protein